MIKKFKACAFIKGMEDSESGDLLVQGVASTEDVDRDGEIVDQKSLADAAASAKSIPVFWQHDWDAPVGKVVEVQPGDGKLYANVSIGKDYEIPYKGGSLSVNSVRKMVEQGIVNAFSIGFEASMQKSEDSDTPVLKVSDIHEISIVTVPANAGALFSVAKMARESFEDEEDDKAAPPRSRFTMEEEDEAVIKALNALTEELEQDAQAYETITEDINECLKALKKS